MILGKIPLPVEISLIKAAEKLLDTIQLIYYGRWQFERDGES